MIRKGAAIVAAGFTLSLMLAGCGGGDEPTVATAATGGPAASASPSSGSGTLAEYVEGQRKWVKCMREQGFNYPDPDARGQFNLSGDDNRKFKADSRFIPAQEACQQFRMEIPAELRPKEEPPTPEQIANRHALAKCMREEGVPDYPDPDANGNFPQSWGNAETNPQEEAATQRAMQICEPLRHGGPKGTYDPNFKFQG
ncbi:hypothetical protein [Micromonospora deserti]|uniref:Lipoprotein n=1 Tax=Micromonospora deserti TaxID=2070366 RepID=A0A2W2D367_9ACTN|nr:hypothetical protein [Micromonospora deserti]PZF91696.1 hypothetical protein C1I99_23000 [Micromonospora deserti]